MRPALKKYVLFLLLGLSFSGSNCEKEVSVSPPEPPVPQCTIAVKSNPSGASIYLNGKITGKVTPDSLRWLAEGTYKITLKKELYRDTTFYMTASEGRTSSIDIDYFADPAVYGSIECLSSPPGAAVYLNYKSTGRTTPCMFTNLLPGKYSIAFQAKGCRDDSLIVEVQSSHRAMASMVLNDTTVWNDYSTLNSSIASNNLSCIKVDKNNVKWIGTVDKGLIRFDNSSWQVFNTGNSIFIPNNYINCLAADKNGIWIGTNKGLSFFDGTAGTVYTTDNSPLPDNYINSVFIDNTGNKWISTLGGLALLQNTGKWQIFNASNSPLPDNAIADMGIDNTGTIWLGMQLQGLISFDGKSKIVLYNKENSKLPGSLVTALCANQSSSEVWAGFASTLPTGNDIGGIATFVNGAWVTVKGMPGTNFNSIEYHQGVHWISTPEGLVKCTSPSSVQIIDRNNSKLTTNFIKQVDFDSNGYMWIATGNAGLVCYKMK